MTQHNEENLQIVHFILSKEGAITKFSGEEAALVATRAQALPEFADSELQYLQVQLDPEREDAETGEMEVRVAGARIRFDQEGWLFETTAAAESDMDEQQFLHETCVQLALADHGVGHITAH